MNQSASYWCQRTLVVTLWGPHGQCVYALGKPWARVGSHASAEVFLPASDAANCSVYFHADQTGIESVRLDVSTHEGAGITRWENATEPIPVGRYRVAVALDADRPVVAATGADAAAAVDGPARFLEVADLRGDSSPTRHCLTQGITLVGSQPPSALGLGRSALAPAHCVLVLQGDNVWVIDLLSGDSTCIDGRHVDAGALSPHGVLEIGDLRLKLLGAKDAASRASFSASAGNGAPEAPVHRFVKITGRHGLPPNGAATAEPLPRAPVLQASAPPGTGGTPPPREIKISVPLKAEPSAAPDLTDRITSKEGTGDRQDRMVSGEFMRSDHTIRALTPRIAALGKQEKTWQLVWLIVIGLAVVAIVAGLTVLAMWLFDGLGVWEPPDV